MTQPRPEKVAEVEALERRLRESSVVILTDYRGLTVSEIGALRGRLRDAALEYRVAKNTLLGRAAERAGVSGLGPFLDGPTAVVFGRDDPGVPARVLQEFIRQYRKLEIKGAVVEGQALGANAVQVLATLPTRVQLLARVAGAVQGPLLSLVSVLSATPRALVTALDAVRKQREGAQAAAVQGAQAAAVQGTQAAAVQGTQAAASEPASAAAESVPEAAPEPAPPEPDASTQA